MPSNYSSEDEAYSSKEEEAQLDQLVENAVQAAAAGENVDQLLEFMLASLPAHLREKLKKKFAALLKKQGLKQPTGKAADTPPRSTLDRLRNALALTAQQAMERVKLLVRVRSDVAERIRLAGDALAKNGVSVNKVEIRAADLHTISPTITAVAQTRGDAGRGA